jgi:hypothetical protein
MREMREMRERDCFARARSADIVPRKETDDERARGGGGESGSMSGNRSLSERRVA